MVPYMSNERGLVGVWSDDRRLMERILIALLAKCPGVQIEGEGYDLAIRTTAPHALASSEVLSYVMRIALADSAAEGDRIRDAFQDAVFDRMGIPITIARALCILIQRTPARSVRLEADGAIISVGSFPETDRAMLLGDLYRVMRPPEAPDLTWASIRGADLILMIAFRHDEE